MLQLYQACVVPAEQFIFGVWGSLPQSDAARQAIGSLAALHPQHLELSSTSSYTAGGLYKAARQSGPTFSLLAACCSWQQSSLPAWYWAAQGSAVVAPLQKLVPFVDRSRVAASCRWCTFGYEATVLRLCGRLGSWMLAMTTSGQLAACQLSQLEYILRTHEVAVWQQKHVSLRSGSPAILRLCTSDGWCAHLSTRSHNDEVAGAACYKKLGSFVQDWGPWPHS